MSKVGLIVLVGIPGAGKTSFCRQVDHYSRAESLPWKSIHFCFDEFIRVEDCSGFEEGNFKVKRVQLLGHLERLVDAIKSHNTELFQQVNGELQQHFSRKVHLSLTESIQYLVLVDDNMYYRSMRHEVYKIARRHGTGYVPVYLDVDLEEAKIRNSRRVAPVPDETILRMWSRMELPNGKVCRWEKNSLRINNFSDDFELVFSHILDRIEHPVEKYIISEGVAEPVEQSALHKLDLLLRKRVGEIVRKNRVQLNADELKVLSEELIAKRKSILNDFRNRIVEIAPEKITDEQICLLLI